MNRRAFLYGAVLAAIFYGCGSNGGGSLSGPSTGGENGIRFTFIQGRQLQQIRKNGMDLLVGNGHYLIGDCDGNDSERNIWSVDGMTDKSGCPGAPYTLSYELSKNDAVYVTSTFGPAPRVRSIHFALDVNMGLFTHFQFSGDPRGKIPFNDDVKIPVAAALSRGQVKWVEYYAPGIATIRRTLIKPFRHVQCNNHPLTNNCDVELAQLRLDQHWRGQKVAYEEEIWVY